MQQKNSVIFFFSFSRETDTKVNAAHPVQVYNSLDDTLYNVNGFFQYFYENVSFYLKLF